MPRAAKKTAEKDVSVVADIANVILVVRGHRLLLDSDLAALYGVTTKRLNEQVKRNVARFPEDFMFRLTADETAALNRSQIATGSQRHRDPRYPPYAFTEHGAIMAAMVLNSALAVEMSVHVVRAFVRLRQLILGSRELNRKVGELERRVKGHDSELERIVAAIWELMRVPIPANRGMGFLADIK